MPNYLEDLSLGLRQAAGVLNPDVQKQTFAADAQKEQQLKQFQLSQLTPQSQLARQQLENEILFRREVSQAGGDQAKIAAASVKYGKPDLAVTIFNQAENRKDRAAQQKALLEQRTQELQLRMDDKAATREQQATYQAMMGKLKEQGLALQSELGNSRLALETLRVELMGDKKLQADEKARLQKVQQLGTAFERANLPQTDSVIREAENAVKNNDVLEYLSGPKSSVPDWYAPDEVNKARQSIIKLFNITLKDRSGAAVTIQELERLKDEFGKGVFKKPEQLRTAVIKAREIVNDHYRGIAAGYGPEALKSYNENLKESGGIPVLEGAKPSNVPAVGTVQGGFKFKGGDPSKPESWEKI